MEDLHEAICILVTKSLSDNQFVDSVLFPLPIRAREEIIKVLYIYKIDEYICEINSHDIRHVNRGHEDEIEYICEIPKILSKFTKIEKSITNHPKTRKLIISVVFYKKYDDKTVKLVKVNLTKEKRLRLKTIFVK
ncbi:MAG: hypothetical protein WC667_02890 [Sulfurimonas sp.]|jgi:hypothetical protein